MQSPIKSSCGRRTRSVLGNYHTACFVIVAPDFNVSAGVDSILRMAKEARLQMHPRRAESSRCFAGHRGHSPSYLIEPDQRGKE